MRWGGSSVVLLAWAALGVGCGAEPSEPIDPINKLELAAHLEAGEEAAWCQYVLPAAGTPSGMWISDLGHASTGALTHHVIWYEMAETPQSLAGKMEPFRCDTGIHLRKKGILYAPPSAEGALNWPAGVAAHLAPDAVTLVEWHVINPSAVAVDASVTVSLAPPVANDPQQAGTLLFYDWFVYVPPHETRVTTMRCRIPADMTLTWASQHMHGRGTGFTARVLDAFGQPTHDLLATDRWDADPVHFEDGLHLQAGWWVEFACTHHNPSDYAVVEGDRQDDEMCMFVGGYYPRMQTPFAEMCQLGQGSGPIFHGTQSCASSLGCLQEATDRESAHACWSDTAAEHSNALVELAWTCASAECRESCQRTGFSAACLSCLKSNCAEPLAACQP